MLLETLMRTNPKILQSKQKTVKSLGFKCLRLKELVFNFFFKEVLEETYNLKIYGTSLVPVVKNSPANAGKTG